MMHLRPKLETGPSAPRTIKTDRCFRYRVVLPSRAVPEETAPHERGAMACHLSTVTIGFDRSLGVGPVSERSTGTT
jgi:hypothetical protein